MNPLDFLSTSIITVLNSGLSDPAVGSAYVVLKAAIRQKFGAGSDLVEALEKLEKQPASAGRQAVLSEEIIAAGANQDPTLTALARTLLDKLKQQPGILPRPASFAAPLQRPLRSPALIGRQSELAQLLADLQPGRVVALCGPGGVGKSTLAAAVVWRLAPADTPPQHFPDGLIYHSFSHQPRVDIALEYIARTLGQSPKPTPYDAVQQALANRQALLVLDSAEQADDLDGILSIRGNCGVLITSRSTHPAVTQCQQLGPLSPAEAVALLQTWPGGPAADPTSQEIGELVGNLPLALQLARQYLAVQRQTPNQYLNWLQTTPLASMESLQRLESCIPWLVEHALGQIDELTRQILAVTGWLALHPFDAEVMAKALTIEPDQGVLASVRRLFKSDPAAKAPTVYPALEKLVNYGLLRQIGSRFQVSHELIYTYARQQLTPPARMIRRLAAYYTALAWNQSAQGSEGYAQLDLERPHLMRVLSECVELQDWEAAYGLAAAIEDYLDRQNYGAERVIANEVGLMAAWQLGRPSEGDWIGNLGDTYRSMGHAKWAIEHFEKALATARQTGDRPAEANSLGNLGLAYRDLGHIEHARQYLQQALVIFEKIHSPSADLVRQWLDELDGK